MVGSQPEDMFLHMPLPPDFFFERAAVKNESQRLLIRQVRHDLSSVDKMLMISSDCPEREATYIITTGGINDPEKA